MNININFFGHMVEVDPGDIADNLASTATRDQVVAEVYDAIDEALRNDCFPEYRADGDDLVDEVMRLLAERAEEPDE